MQAGLFCVENRMKQALEDRLEQSSGHQACGRKRRDAKRLTWWRWLADAVCHLSSSTSVTSREQVEDGLSYHLEKKKNWHVCEGVCGVIQCSRLVCLFWDFSSIKSMFKTSSKSSAVLNPLQSNSLCTYRIFYMQNRYQMSCTVPFSPNTDVFIKTCRCSKQMPLTV